MANLFVMKNDPNLSKVIWPSFKENIEEKHGYTGAKGHRGEDNAQNLLLNKNFFPELDTVIRHEDALHQYMGIDFTVRGKEGKLNFVDVKSGRSALYWKESTGWYITFRTDWLDKKKKTEYYMHVGPKGDVFAYYEIKKLTEWFNKNSNKITINDDGIILYKPNWPSIIKTNL